MGPTKLDLETNGTKQFGDRISRLHTVVCLNEMPWQELLDKYFGVRFLFRRVVRVTGSGISAFQIPGIPHFRLLDFHMSRFLEVQIATVSFFWNSRFHIVTVFVWDEITRVPWQLFSASTCSGQLFLQNVFLHILQDTGTHVCPPRNIFQGGQCIRSRELFFKGIQGNIEMNNISFSSSSSCWSCVAAVDFRFTIWFKLVSLCPLLCKHGFCKS